MMLPTKISSLISVCTNRLRRKPITFLQLILPLIVISTVAMVSGQSISPKTVATAGQSFQHPSGISVDFTIGEVAVQTYHSNNAIVTEGLHQPTLILRTPTNLLNPLKIKIFPNPSSTRVHIVAEQDPQMYIELRHVTGKRIGTYTFHQSGDIDVSHLPSGTYLLTIHTGKERPYSIPLIKH